MSLRPEKPGERATMSEDQEDIPALQKPQKQRWRLAFTAIYSTRVLVSLCKKQVVGDNNVPLLRSLSYTAIDLQVQPNNATMSEDQEDIPALPKPQKQRWRLAFTAIYSTRALVSLCKKQVVGENNAPLLRSLSYTVIDVQVQPNNAQLHEHLPFLNNNIDQQMLTNMVKEKNIELLSQYGGSKELVAILRSDAKSGISDSDVADLMHRKNVFGANIYQKLPAPKGFLSFVFEAILKDTTIIILVVCGILSLGFGVKQDGFKDGWYDGGGIIFAVLLVVVVSAVSNFRQSRQFDQRLSTKISGDEHTSLVEIMRDGLRRSASISDILVGDVVCLKIGDQVPADGLFLEGFSLKVMNGDSRCDNILNEINDRDNPFLFSGTKVTEGFGLMLVTSVGMNTSRGEMIMSSIGRDLDRQTPLQTRLNKLTSSIGKVGLAVDLLVLLASLIHYFTGNTKDNRGNRKFSGSQTKFDDVMNTVVDIVAAAITTAVEAIPEGLPLAVTLTLAYSMKKMMNHNALVRKLSACEVMGSATTICTDKTGTLTLNQMKVTEFWLGTEAMTEKNLSEIEPTILQLLQQAVGLSTAGSIRKPPNSSSFPEKSGSPTEKAILSWGMFDFGVNIDKVKQGCEIIHEETFNSHKKRSGVLMRRNNEKATQTHWKGAAEMILSMCSNYYDKTGTVKAINDGERMHVESIVQNMAAKGLRCIAFAHKIVLQEENGRVNPEKLEESGLTLLGLVGLKDPCKPGVRTAVDTFRAAKVNIKMMTGDHVHTARAIAVECGILKPYDEDLEDDQAVVEGAQFRNYSHEEMMEKIDKIRVMAISSPSDKLLMVQCLKQKGNVVAVIGDGTNDTPALKEADIGLSMGVQGTEVAKESSDIVILDDKFSSVVTVLRWGRCVYSNIQKFLQFQLTVILAALVINFVGAVSSGKVPLTAVQLLWVNLIMDTLGALALATEQPTNDLMEKQPVGRTEPLITRDMWRNLIAQALYQVTMLLTLQFKGRSIFGVDEKVKNTLIFNTFVLCQVFNEFNARFMEKNTFKGLLKNKLFLAIIGITIVLQMLVVKFLMRLASTERLDWGQWGACIGIAALSWPIGWLVKHIPVSGYQVASSPTASCS